MSSRLGMMIVVILLMGCGSGPTNPGNGGMSNAHDCTFMIFANTCATAGCHVTAPGSMPQANLVLTAAAVGDGSKLVNAKAQGSFCSVGGSHMLIDPQHPSQSLIYSKTQATPACGPRMPFGMPALSASQQQCVLDWIKTVPGVTGSASAEADSPSIDNE